jgi:hypothetical protein
MKVIIKFKSIGNKLIAKEVFLLLHPIIPHLLRIINFIVMEVSLELSGHPQMEISLF